MGKRPTEKAKPIQAADRQGKKPLDARRRYLDLCKDFEEIFVPSGLLVVIDDEQYFDEHGRGRCDPTRLNAYTIGDHVNSPFMLSQDQREYLKGLPQVLPKTTRELYEDHDLPFECEFEVVRDPHLCASVVDRLLGIVGSGRLPANEGELEQLDIDLRRMWIFRSPRYIEWIGLWRYPLAKYESGDDVPVSNVIPTRREERLVRFFCPCDSLKKYSQIELGVFIHRECGLPWGELRGMEWSEVAQCLEGLARSKGIAEKGWLDDQATYRDWLAQKEQCGARPLKGRSASDADDPASRERTTEPKLTASQKKILCVIGDKTLKQVAVASLLERKLGGAIKTDLAVLHNTGILLHRPGGYYLNPAYRHLLES
jgi:hypothetical protein